MIYTLHILLIVALATFIIGIFAPMATFEKFYVFENTYSLFTALKGLVFEGEYFVFIIILSFSIMFPIAKILSLYYIILFVSTKRKAAKILKILRNVSKWSMLDVFVVAFFVMTIKVDAIANVEIHMGIYSFTISVLLTSISANLLGKYKKVTGYN